MDVIENSPAEPDTLTAATDRFRAQGYRADFSVEGGMLVSERCPEKYHRPESVVIEDLRRFEGVTNPSDEAVVFAIRCREHGTRGVLVSSYGPLSNPDDQDVLARLGETH